MEPATATTPAQSSPTDSLTDLWEDDPQPEHRADTSTATLGYSSTPTASGKPQSGWQNETPTEQNEKPLSALLAAMPRPRNAEARYREIDTTPCPTCFAVPPAIGRKPLDKLGSGNKPFTVPCPTCVAASKARAAAYDWRKDPAFGICNDCRELLVINAAGELDPCDMCPGAPQRESDAAYAKRARVPIRYADCRVGNWLPATGRPRQAVAGFTAQWPPAKGTLLLEGETGTGKTHLAIGALFDAWTRHGIFGQFWPVIDLLERFRRTMQGDRAQETAEQIEAALDRVDLLVLDDLGAQRDTDYAGERLFSLIDHRYSRRLPTIVTTNVELMALPDRVRSRMQHGEIVICHGKDYRSL